MALLSPDEMKTFVEKPFTFLARVGLIAYRLAPRRVKLGAPLAGNGNHIGSMYAGARGKSGFLLKAAVEDTEGQIVAETEGACQLRVHQC